MSKYLSFDNESDKFRFVEICADRKDGFITGAIPAKRDIRNSIHTLFFDDKIFAAAFGTKTIKQTQISVKCAYTTSVFYCIILVKTEECV